MLERDMEDLIANYPDDFFPTRGFELKGRQQSFAEVGRFDLMFQDHFNTTILMELKAVTAKYEVATQLAKYRDELIARGEKHIVMWLVAPQIPPSIREFLDRIGIQYTEIHFGEFRQVAERRGFSIRHESTQTETAIEKTGNRASGGNILPSNQARVGSQVPTGPQVTLNSGFRWKAYGYDLALESSKSFDAAKFSRLIEAFQDSVPSMRNARLVDDLKQWGAKPDSMHWSHRANASLLRWVTTRSYKTAVPHAFAIWKYLFGEPAPTWYVWHQESGRYEFDVGAWKIWFESLNQGR